MLSDGHGLHSCVLNLLPRQDAGHVGNRVMPSGDFTRAIGSS